MKQPPDSPEALRRRTWATVDLDALAHNVRVLRGRLPSRTAFMAVVKADGYGHGAVAVAEQAVAAGASWLGVATAEEAVELRAAGIAASLLVLGPVDPAWVPALVDLDCALTIGGRASVPPQTDATVRRPARVHIELDTGMTRIGITPDELPGLLRGLDPNRVTVEGLFTHLACADARDLSMARAQIAAFLQAADWLRARVPDLCCHAAASAGMLAVPEAAFDMVRVGIAMYGVNPTPDRPLPLQPVMTLRSRVVRARRVAAGTPVSYGATYRTRAATTIVTVPVGYADGYPRALSAVGSMLVAGVPCPVAGRVCMDYTMLDAGDAPVREGDEATVFGGGLPAEDVASAAGTIAYELFCGVGRRVPRIYLGAGRPTAIAVAGRGMMRLDAGAEAGVRQ
jgi:alanine racemase